MVKSWKKILFSLCFCLPWTLLNSPLSVATFLHHHTWTGPCQLLEFQLVGLEPTTSPLRGRCLSLLQHKVVVRKKVCSLYLSVFWQPLCHRRIYWGYNLSYRTIRVLNHYLALQATAGFKKINIYILFFFTLKLLNIQSKASEREKRLEP